MSDSPGITRINPPELGTPPGYSQIVEVSAKRLLFIAGQTALDREGHVVGMTLLRRQPRSSKISRWRCGLADARHPIW